MRRKLLRLLNREAGLPPRLTQRPQSQQSPDDGKRRPQLSKPIARRSQRCAYVHSAPPKEP